MVGLENIASAGSLPRKKHDHEHGCSRYATRTEPDEADKGDSASSLYRSLRRLGPDQILVSLSVLQQLLLGQLFLPSDDCSLVSQHVPTQDSTLLGFLGIEERIGGVGLYGCDKRNDPSE